MKKEKVIQACTGEMKSTILTDVGKVYIMGQRERNINVSTNVYVRLSPHLIHPKYFNHEKIVNIRAGKKYTMALSQEGNLYMWGRIKNMDLMNDDAKNFDVPRKIDLKYFNKEKIKFINGCSHNSYFVITENNNVYSWGKNKFGQLGLGHCETQVLPKLVRPKTYNNEKAVKICCGNYCSLLLTDQGNLFSCGYGYNGELGIRSHRVKKSYKRIKSSRFENNKIKDIELSNFALALTESGSVYAWGCNTYSQLGVNSTEYTKNIPCLIDSKHFENDRVLKIGCSVDQSYFVTNSGKFYCCGFNMNNELLMGHFNNVSVPKQMEQQRYFGENRIINMSSGWAYDHYLAITKCGALFVWGNNFFGQLGIDKRSRNVHEPQQCHHELFGSNILKNEKMYQNEFSNDIVVDFE